MKNISLLLIVLISMFACKDNVEQLASVENKIDKRTVVEIEAISKSTTAMPVHAIGRLASDEEVKLSFKIGGVIASINAKEGQRVRKDQLLAALRTNEIDAQVLKANQALEKAQRDLKRVNEMYAEKAATLENVQDLTTLVEVSQADLNIALFNQKYAQIYSPINGRIIKRLAEANEVVGPGQPLFLIASNEGKAFVMKVALSDKDIARVNYGDKTTTFFDAFPQAAFEGQISLIAESADPRTGTFEVELTVPTKGHRLRNGYIGRVEILPQKTAPYFTIPMDALVEANNKAIIIFIPNEEQTIAKEITVEPLNILGDAIAIKDPKMDGFDSVITTGAPYLMDGDSIRVAHRIPNELSGI